MIQDRSDTPLVSIGIPLFRALRFIPKITRNIRSIDYPNLEFLLSDRHGDGRVVGRLQERLGNDPRVRYLLGQDALNWIENYNLLLEEASGKYFRLLAQDDRILETSIRPAVAYLEAHPDVVAVDGPVDLIDARGQFIRYGSCPEANQSRSGLSSWTRRVDSLLLLGGCRHPNANLGLIRLSVCRSRHLSIPLTYDLTGLSMRAWLFGLSLEGEIHSLLEYRNQRCLHPESFTSLHFTRSAKAQIRRLFSYWRAAIQILRASPRGVCERWLCQAGVFISCLLTLPLLRVLQRPSAAWKKTLNSGLQNV